MAYIGAEPLPGQNREVDDISSSFNGSTTAFTLQVSGVNVSPESANNILVNIGGVLQNPGTDYTIAASTITFTTAPASGLSFFAIILGAGINTATVADGVITSAKLASDLSLTGDVSIADKIVHTGDTNTAIRFPAADTFTAETGGSERLRVDSAGRILIGTTSAVIGSSSEFNEIVLSGKTRGAGITLQDVDANTRFQIRTDDNGDGTLLNASTNHPIAIRTNNTERMRIDASGKFSLGRTNQITVASNTSDSVFEQLTNSSWPLALHSAQSNKRGLSIFYADTGAGNAGDPYILCQNQTSTKFQVISNGNVQIPIDDGELQLGASQDFRLFHDGTSNKIIAQNGELLVQCETYSIRSENGGTIYATIDSSGRVGINTSSPKNSFKTTILQDTSGHGCLALDRTSNIDGTLRSMVTFERNGTGVGTITCSNSATAYNTSSDHRLKENIVTMSNATDRLKQLQPKRFNFIINPDTTVDGFLAHEVQSVVPEAISGTKDEVDSDNNPVYQGIDQSKLVPLLTAALQESVKKIETLETKVAALEAA